MQAASCPTKGLALQNCPIFLFFFIINVFDSLTATYIESDETSKSSSNSFCGERTLLDTLKRRLYSSESSTDSDEYKQRQRVVRPMRGRFGSSAVQARPHRAQSKSLKVTPRSASGLKFRISTSETSGGSVGPSVNVTSLPIIDYIQISSSSSSDEVERFAQLQTVREEDDMTADPLYEEEIPLYRI